MWFHEVFHSEFGFRWRQCVINVESEGAKTFYSVTDPGVLLHMSWTHEGEEGSKFSGNPVLMKEFIPLEGLWEENWLQTFQKYDCIRLKKPKTTKLEERFSSLNPFKWGTIFTIKKKKIHIALHVIPENICHLLGAGREREKREKKLMKYKITLESILMTAECFQCPPQAAQEEISSQGTLGEILDLLQQEGKEFLPGKVILHLCCCERAPFIESTKKNFYVEDASLGMTPGPQESFHLADFCPIMS